MLKLQLLVLMAQLLLGLAALFQTGPQLLYLGPPVPKELPHLFCLGHHGVVTVSSKP